MQSLDAKPLFETPAECIAALRTHAEGMVRDLLLGTRFGKPLKPVQRKILEAKVDSICTAIEIINGNSYYFELGHIQTRMRARLGIPVAAGGL